MLVLTRRNMEQIIIAGNIKITVLAADNGKCRIGIEAPREVTIDRVEIHEAKREAACRAK